MTLRELEQAYWTAREKGHQWIQLQIARKHAPKNWDRVRVLPGLYGKIRGELIRGVYVADVTRDDLGIYLVKAQAESFGAPRKEGTE